MVDDLATTDRESWLSEYRRERCLTLERENTYLRTELDRAIRWIDSLCRLAGDQLGCQPRIVLGVIADTEELQERFRLLVEQQSAE